MKISDCKRLFHTKCIQNGGVLQLPCVQQPYPGVTIARRKNRKHPRVVSEKSGVSSALVPVTVLGHNTASVRDPTHSKFSLTGTSEFTDSTDKIISDAKELQLMQNFINKKVIFKLMFRERFYF